MTDPSFHHVPVLADTLIDALQISDRGYYLDCTVGGGGHSERILLAAQDVRLVAIDQDAIALQAAQTRLAPFGNQVEFWHGNFSTYQPSELGQFDGMIADLGVSSAQLDRPERGFSFRESGDLDMRMDRRQELTAADIVNTYAEKTLADIFFTLGEERLSRRIARNIVEQRPFQTTTQLADVIARCVPGSYRHGRIHPATRVFQALRIEVNQELKVLETWLQQSVNWLKPHGKIAVISFHSLEDRIVKHTFRQDERLQIITKKPLIATDEEIRQNPRSRSAKLRLATKVKI
ncbi:16S rRNA (cytosine(1402)-N(4))-methyltransferase RsmH [Tumidithrix elongata RA019]|uniref:Ribosomal RNA small subunit methyltransferase H n=1 Tax=Tumidithrix elongata BACA0141 TaxID=2716417 RepID=A0AAW9PXK6_9CYAN|nr:16S rRNA (cytosine(1402)-N(4))-methyltransferase RsmH [Tumidithrix elongata RA019]